MIKRIVGRLLAVALPALLLVGPAHADSYSKVTTVKGLTFEPGTNTVRVILTDATGAYEPCSSETWYAFSMADAGGKEMYATLLAAKLGGDSLFLQSRGCITTYSKVTLVYLCDTIWCQ